MKCSLNFEAKAFYTSVVSIVFDGTKGGECLTGAEGSKQFADTLSQMEGLEAGCHKCGQTHNLPCYGMDIITSDNNLPDSGSYNEMCKEFRINPN